MLDRQGLSGQLIHLMSFRTEEQGAEILVNKVSVCKKTYGYKKIEVMERIKKNKTYFVQPSILKEKSLVVMTSLLCISNNFNQPTYQSI